MNPADLITQEPFKSLFPIKNQTLGAIAATMMKSGFDPAHPIIIWKGRNIVVDGHTRLDAAIAAGIEDVPVVEHDFPSEDVAVRYAIDCQRNRRNLTDADIMRLVQELDKRRQQGERTDLAQGCAKSGKSASDTAEAIGVSTRKVEQVRTVLDKAAPEVKKAVEAGDMTINAAAKTVSGKKPLTEAVEATDKAVQQTSKRPPHLAAKVLRSAWISAKKSERESFLEWVDRERSKDLPKSNYQDAKKLASKLRRALKNADPGIVNMIRCELGFNEGSK